MRQRRAYTLLEVLLALAVAVLLLGAVYSVIGYQLRYAQDGRDLVERTVLARAILQRMSGDVSAAIALGDPARFRRTQATQAAAGSTASTGAGAAADPAANTDPAATDAAATSTVAVPLGVIGTTTELHLFISKLTAPQDADGEGDVACDLRRVSYWVPDDTTGLCRLELRQVTSEDATNTTLPGDSATHQFAAEVKQVEFAYFDGTSWMETWDSTELGDDGKTPRGSPRAIRLSLTMKLPGQAQLKTFRHVVHVVTAGGTPQQSTTGAGTTTP